MTENYFSVSENFVSLEIPSHLGFGGGTFIFSNEGVQYGKKHFRYDEITAVSYSMVNTTGLVAIIPVSTSQNYHYTLKTKDNKIKISYETSYKINNKRLSDIFSKLVYFSKTLIEPVLIAKYMEQIFDEGKFVNVCGVGLESKGFNFNRHLIKWTEDFYRPEIVMGEVVFYIDKKGKPKQAYKVNIKNDNAGLLPELIMACFSYVNSPKSEREIPNNDDHLEDDEPYNILGVPKSATWNQIEEAYKLKAQQYHPDKVAGLAPDFIAFAEEKMKVINGAYAQLKGKYKG